MACEAPLPCPMGSNQRRKPSDGQRTQNTHMRGMAKLRLLAPRRRANRFKAGKDRGDDPPAADFSARWLFHHHSGREVSERSFNLNCRRNSPDYRRNRNQSRDTTGLPIPVHPVSRHTRWRGQRRNCAPRDTDDSRCRARGLRWHGLPCGAFPYGHPRTSPPITSPLRRSTTLQQQMKIPLSVAY
jgi:hypothetical protein